MVLAALLLNLNQVAPDMAGDVDSIRRWQKALKHREDWKQKQRQDDEARRRHIEDAVARLRKLPEAAARLAQVLPNADTDARIILRNQVILLLIEQLYLEYLEEEDLLLLYMEMM